MKDIDEKIRQLLSEDELAALNGLKDDTPIDLIAHSFRGWSQWGAGLVITMSFAATVFAFYCALRFFDATTTETMLPWLGGFLACISTIGMCKMWYWMELNKIAVQREIKRVELQLAHLAQSLNK
jgi:hypothetical protein